MENFRHGLSSGLYSSRDGIVLGVCRGLADYFDFSVFWIRMITVILILISGFWPIIGIYFIAALLMKPKPILPINTDDELEFYDSYTHSKSSSSPFVLIGSIGFGFISKAAMK